MKLRISIEASNLLELVQVIASIEFETTHKFMQHLTFNLLSNYPLDTINLFQYSYASEL